MHNIIIDFIKVEILSNSEHQLNIKDELLEKGIVDSMGMMRLVLYVEKKFEIKVRPEHMTFENFKNVESIVNYITRVVN